MATGIFLTLSLGCVKENMREMDALTGLCGDEFVPMLCELTDDRAESSAKALGVADKIRGNLATPYELIALPTGQPAVTVVQHCSASIGGVVFTNHQVSQTDLLNWDDAAMYQANGAGRIGLRLYVPEPAPKLPVA